jgi:Uncharacterized conserved small protein containing a coiled-coil domain
VVYGATVDISLANLALISQRLPELRAEHRALDQAIDQLAANPEDELELKRLKRRRLQLKDCITQLENLLIPDEPA